MFSTPMKGELHSWEDLEYIQFDCHKGGGEGELILLIIPVESKVVGVCTIRYLSSTTGVPTENKTRRVERCYWRHCICHDAPSKSLITITRKQTLLSKKIYLNLLSSRVAVKNCQVLNRVVKLLLLPSYDCGTEANHGILYSFIEWFPPIYGAKTSSKTFNLWGHRTR
jgi:hypothetical protein